MGGKTKQAPRTKNNAQPSNSGRSAELLGSAAPAFVGFTTHSDFGMVPFAPGFSNTESLPETFDSNITPEYQVILRKLSKKHPVTKIKTLQELNTQILESDIEIIKSILPLWPKFYQNLSNDFEYRVRALTQTVQSNIALKSGKFIAPYIKQLAPMWISSRFDNYVPAGSIALTSFKSSFPPHKVQEVLLYCQNEIIDYLARNLTFHTASTLSNNKSVSPEDAENIYERVIINSLKTFSLFLELTFSKSNLDVDNKCQNLLQNQKLWSFSKHKNSKFRSAFFELICSVLQYAPRLIELNRIQVIQICFLNLDDSDPLTSPHVWGCILLVQTIYIDWHEHVSFKKVIQPKFNNIFKTILNGNASSIARNFLPFLSNVSESGFEDLNLYEFYSEFFENVKRAIESSSQSNSSKKDAASLVTVYFECLRFVFKKISNDIIKNESLQQVPQEYLEKYIINFLEWSLESENLLCSKIIYKHCSALIAYWSSNCEIDCYVELLKVFWSSFLNMITKSVSTDNLKEVHIKNILELIKNLYTSSPGLHENKVKFGDNSNEKKDKSSDENKLKCSNYVAKDLKEIVIKIVKIYMESTSYSNLNKYAAQIKILCQMFGDIDFYKRLSSDECLLTTLSKFMQYIEKSEDLLSEDLIDIIFEIIYLLDIDQKMEQLKTIIKSRNSKVQLWVLGRMLSYPLCLEPNIRNILAENSIKEIILRVSQEAVNENSTEKFNLLHKCFFQNDAGEILINQEVVECIINSVIEPLFTLGKENMIDTCGSFVAQVMPVLCVNDNATKNFRYKIFMELFKFSINSFVNDNLSKDSLWEITTCWQDALSCEDISLDDSLLNECKIIIENKLKNNYELSMEELDNISDTLTKLIYISTEHLKKNNEKSSTINLTSDLYEKSINILLHFSDLEKSTLTSFDNICKFYETLEKVITPDNITNDYCKNICFEELTYFYRKMYLIFTVISTQILDENIKKSDIDSENNEEISEEDDNIGYEINENSKYKLSLKLSTQLCELINNCVAFSAIGESLIKHSSLINNEAENIILTLSEKIKFLLKNASEYDVNILKEDIIQKASNGHIMWLRTLPYLLSTNCFQQYKENAPILLLEEISDSLLANGQLEIYNNLAEVILPYLTSRSLLLNEDIMKNSENIKFCSSLYKNLFQNHMSSTSYSKIEDRNLVLSCINFITITGEKQTIKKDLFLYNTDISTKEFKDVISIIEFIKLLTETIQRFPTELNIKNWDSIRIGLCSWVLTISKSIENFNDSKVALFSVAVYELFASLSKFIKEEKSKSSTQFHSNIIDEWENVFAKEVNLVLFKNYNLLVKDIVQSNNVTFTLLDKIASCVIYLDFNTIYNACQSGFQLNVNDLIEFSLHNLLNHRNIRKVSVNILKSISIHLMKQDLEKFERNNENFNAMEKSGEDWHFLKKFEVYFEAYGQVLEEFSNEFSYKMSELQDMKLINKEAALTYFYLWDCIIYIFSKSPAELKSVYATWITNNKFEHVLLNFIFRAMPLEILKNHDQKSLSNDVFKTNLSESQFQNGILSVEKCACYMYTQMLRYLPVIVRKWWNGTHARQKNFIDKLTTNYVSNLIWLEDMRTINKTDKQENMQITVHQSTREVIAAYSIDEARLELIITLPQNHPLGIIKVEMGKQIGGKTSSRNIGMQLTIFLTHQNGSIFDGLLLWKKNLDKKFSGVEECYVCYTVIHQDTCQLPKLTCKTCKKKFHGPCLYKWFTTSSKSTCPLCRNVF